MMESRIAAFTHHKCGSTWLCWVLGELLSHNQVPYYWSDQGTAVPAVDHPVSILQNASYNAVRCHLAAVNIHFVRNPLSILLSAYHSHKRTHPTDGWSRLSHQRQLLQSCDVQSGLFLTLAFLQSPEFCPETPGPFASLRSWDYTDDRFMTIRMEDAVLDPSRFLTYFRSLSGLDNLTLPPTDHFHFETFTGRKVGQVDSRSHYRSGDPEAWRRELPDVIIDYVRDEFRPFLERFYPEALSDSVGSYHVAQAPIGLAV